MPVKVPMGEATARPSADGQGRNGLLGEVGGTGGVPQVPELRLSRGKMMFKYKFGTSDR
jgi:hypothetical protein